MLAVSHCNINSNGFSLLIQSAALIGRKKDTRCLDHSPSESECMDFFTPFCPCYPLTLPYRVTSFRAGIDRSNLPPCLHNPDLPGEPELRPIERSSFSEETIKFFLQRSLYDFVLSHPKITLTDPRLTDWYLCWSTKYKQVIQDEGGLYEFVQTHPGIELLFPHICLKRNIGGHAAMPNWKCKQQTSGARSTFGGIGTASTHQASYVEPRPPHRRQLHDPLLTQLGVATPALVEWWDPVRPLAGFPRDLDLLDRWHQSGHLRSQMSADGRCWTMSAEDSVRADCPPVEIQLRSEMYSLTGDEVKVSEHTSLSPKPGQVDTPMSVENEDLNDDTVVPSTDKQGSIMKDDGSIICVVREDGKAQTGEAPLGVPNLTGISTADKWTSCVPCVASCAVMVGPPHSERSSAFCQTEDQATADKSVVTKLDDVIQPFNQLKSALEVKQPTQKSLDVQPRRQCDCVPRAQRAELSLLALQYHMCRRHCWTLQPPGNTTHPLQTVRSANIVATLQKLECDYNQMRDKILAGVHLKHLKPLSVYCDRTTSIPMLDVLKGVSPGRSQMAQEEEPPNEHSSSQDAPRKVSVGQRIKTDSAKSRSTCTHVSWDNVGGCKELNTGEVWYDAEEDPFPTSSVERPGEMSKGLVNKEIMASVRAPNPSCNVTEVATRPPLGQLGSVISSTPTPGVTFVPQCFWTMSGFDTLMAELTRFHPNVGRKRIAGTLKELWDTYQDALCPLPLSTITQMASDLLIRPANATQAGGNSS
ncbi:RNA-binding protein 44 isoform X3 [Dunckerocampus dactyliophorus]|uniref:RNA-binding protein 44 isoform X3 n=1 Tax=Dunckerocampus dactyliophorus TaxID=161453 RepID=UPI0024070655|nr:RNA-binding protein 44 isoform X3 [Dunckerocampus dactyliophorus]